MNEVLTNLSKVLPALAILAVVFGFIGWSLRGLRADPPAAATKPGKPLPTNDKGRDERVKNLESSLEKSRTALKTAKAELESLKSATVIKESHDSALAELENARESLAREAKRTATMETELKRVQETLRGHNTRATSSDKAQKERDFALQNELSKARQQLAEMHGRPDDTAALHSEIERLRESVATSTRFAGELRKRETAALEELEKLKNNRATSPRAAMAVGPVAPPQESSRVAAAKAEVLRLVEQNKRAQQATEIALAAPAVTDESPLPIEPAAAIVEPEIFTAEPMEVSQNQTAAPENTDAGAAPAESDPDADSSLKEETKQLS